MRPRATDAVVVGVIVGVLAIWSLSESRVGHTRERELTH